MNTCTHMPFEAYAHGFGKALFFCRKNALGRWRLFISQGGHEQEMATGLPAEWNICCPAAEYDGDDLMMSIIAGPPDGQYHLYRLAPDTDGVFRQVSSTPADAGYWRENWTVTATRHGPVNILHNGIRRLIHIEKLNYIYRVSFDASQPNCIMVTADVANAMTLYRIPVKDISAATVITLPSGACPYKGVMSPDGRTLLYAERTGDDFEDRRIAKTTNYTAYKAKGITMETINTAENKSCPACFRKHISAALSYAKEIMAGHGENADLDHRPDLEGEIVAAEDHANAMRTMGYVTALRKLRHELDALGWHPAEDHLATLRKLWNSSNGLSCTCSNH